MIRRFAFSLSLGLLIGVGGALPAHAQQGLSVQETVLRAKPATVLIISEVSAEVTLNCGGGSQTVKPAAFRETGTGWFIDPSGWVITNGHVVQPAHEPPRWLINQMAERAVTRACLGPALEAARMQPGDQPAAEEALKRRLLDKVLPTVKVTITPQVSVVLSSGTRLKAEVKKYSPPASTEPGAPSARDLALLKVPAGNYPVLPLADATVQIGDPIRILGFPGVVLSHELLNKSASLDASVTTGAVSGLKEDKANHPFIQTDASAAWGNSGGPAINTKAELVGVLTFVSLAPGAEGSIVQGFNFAIPTQTVKTFVADQFVKLNQPGKFNPVWFAGLRDYFTDNWKGAKRKFEEADKIQPGLVDVKRMLGEATENIKNPPPRPFPWFWVTIGVTLLSAGGYGAQFAIRWHKNRYRVGPSEIIKLAESGREPIILDTRQQKQYDQNPIKIHGSIRLSPEDLKSGAAANLDLDKTRPVVAYCT
ncbi:MAG: trypsin-like peptidase domain-containing protein [Candidatus Rokubacteria bacterium]|nr:trypsin-like peptidase domain-containing protein [Candidatus Rokubacteria bacterium]